MKTVPTTDELLVEAVEFLNERTPDQIAQMMKRASIQGRPGTTGRCPIAMLMHNTHGGQFIVGPNFIGRRSGGGLVKIPTPANVKAFIRKFDLSGYPDLLAPPPRVMTEHKKSTAPTRPGRRGKKRAKAVNHPAKECGRWEEKA